MPYTILSVLFSLLYLFFDKTKYKVFAMGSSALVFFYGVSIDLMDHPEIQIFFKYKKPTLTYITYSFFFITLIALLLSNILVYFFYNREVYEIPQKKYSNKKLKRAFYILSFLTFAGLAANLINVFRSGFTVELLVLNPREYEELFGFNVLLNYLYFLNIPAILVYIYVVKVHETKVPFGKILVFFLIAISGFHGIKYTIFDSILIPGFFFLLISKDTKLKYMAMVFGLLIGIYSIFSAFVRGGYYDSQLLNFVSYIIPNYLNMFYNIETYQTQFTPFYNLILPDKIQGLIPPELQLNPGVNSTYSINPSYNMYTSLDFLYTDFNLLGPLFFIVIVGVAILLYNNKYKNIIIVYLLADIVYNFNMSFYTYSYIKIKYFYYIGVFVIVHLLCQEKKTKNENIDLSIH
jgi:hypothetical protein